MYAATVRMLSRLVHGNVIPMEFHGKRPKGWDGTAHICISHETHK